jgi:hypothetical protein
MKSTQVALYLCPPTHLTPPPSTAQAETSAGGGTPLPYKTLVAVADQLNEQLSQNDYAAAISGFDEALKIILPENQLEQVWRTIIRQDGNPRPKRLSGGIVSSKDHYDAIVTFLEFEKSRYGLLVIVDTISGEICGLCPLPLLDPKE